MIIKEVINETQSNHYRGIDFTGVDYPDSEHRGGYVQPAVLENRDVADYHAVFIAPGRLCNRVFKPTVHYQK
jgi:hypothetical protein